MDLIRLLLTVTLERYGGGVGRLLLLLLLRINISPFNNFQLT
jgi:hypothetical protein